MKGKLLALASILASVAFVPAVSAQTLDDLNSNFTHDETKKVYTVNDETVTVSDKLEINDDVTIDLDGKTLAFTGDNHLIIVNGGHTLTITDSSENKNGKITSDYYGVLAKSGAKVVIENGDIVSKYAALSSNNTTGNGNFEIKSGTISATEGPAIYMPAQGDLTITGGTINGGIALRMGNVKISGGTINASTNEDAFDNLKDDYAFTGNLFLPDALYILAGTYNSGDNNDLTLDITGGTFNSENGQGSAIAVYDLGKVDQEANVKISGNAILKTNAETRNAYDVLGLEELGIDPDVATEYGKTSGKTVTTISGGSFIGGLDDKYIPEGMKVDESGKLVSTVVEEASSTAKEDPKNPDTSDTILYSVIAIIVAGLGLTFVFRKLHNN